MLKIKEGKERNLRHAAFQPTPARKFQKVNCGKASCAVLIASSFINVFGLTCLHGGAEVRDLGHMQMSCS